MDILFNYNQQPDQWKLECYNYQKYFVFQQVSLGFNLSICTKKWENG